MLLYFQAGCQDSVVMTLPPSETKRKVYSVYVKATATAGM